MPVHVRKAAIDAVVIEGQFLMIDSEQVQNRGVKVINRHWVLTGEVADFVRPAITETFFHARARQKAREGVGMMIPAQSANALSGGTASEFCAPNDQGIFQHAALF